MVDTSRNFRLLVRLGYAARGLVYILLGYLALSSTGKASAGPESSFDLLQDVALGSAVLYAAATGLLAYAIYKLIAALGDLERHGSEAKGIAQRIGYFASGLAHTVMAWTAFQFAHGDKQSTSGDGSGAAASTVISWGLGAMVLGLIGAGSCSAPSSRPEAPTPRISCDRSAPARPRLYAGSAGWGTPLGPSSSSSWVGR